MITFYMVRHGETLFNKKHLMQGWCDSPLTEEGIEKAKELGKQLADMQFTAVYASSSERAWHTAEYVMAENKLPQPVQIRKELKEMNFGIMEGENEYVGRIAQQEAHMLDGWVKEGGENQEMLMNRVMTVLDEIAEKHKEGNILILTHGVVLMSLLRLLKPGYMEAKGPAFRIKNCSVTKMIWENGNYTILDDGE